ncbi:MAG: hypothetical protein ABIG84_04015 [archaeon]
MRHEILIAIILIITISISGCTQSISPADKPEITQTDSIQPTEKKEIENTEPTDDTQESQPEDKKEIAKQECINLCQQELIKGTDLKSGPCLSDPDVIADDWVCDVAHDPRQPIDNQQENQCKAFRDGKAQHFIELDETCRIIKEH